MTSISALLADPGNQTTLIWLGGGLMPPVAILWLILRLVAKRANDPRRPRPAGAGRPEARYLAGLEIILLVLVAVAALMLGAGLLGRKTAGSRHQAEQPQVVAVGWGMAAPRECFAMVKPFAVCLVTVLLLASAAAEDRKLPMPDMSTGGSEQQTPNQPIVGEGAHQILVRNIVGQPLYGRDGSRLGTVKDALVDRSSNTLTVLIVDTGDGGERVVAWPSVDASDRKHITANLTKADFQDTSPAGQAEKTRDYFSISDQLLGRKVVDRSGKTLGEARDAVTNMQDGHLVAMLVDPHQGFGIGTRGAPHAVPWNAVALPADKNQPIRLALAKDEFDKEPAFVSKAPASPAKSGPFSGSEDNPKSRSERPVTQGPGERVLPPSPPPTRRAE